ncbi:MAG: hypothetical protein AAGJ94_17975 [Pseudomonadota bacterium]
MMLNFFARPKLDPVAQDWIFENFTWLMREFGGGGEFNKSTLVLPKPGFFPIDGETGDARAQKVFQAIKDYAGMGDWPVTLVADDDPKAIRGEPSLVSIQHGTHALGRFVADQDGAMITYTPMLLAEPMQLIGTLAHELSHYLLCTGKTDPPSDEDENEYLTDLCTVFLGFGVFLANTRFNTEVVAMGPMSGVGWRQSGYLPEPELVFATALFLKVQGIDPAEAQNFLKPHLAKALKHAFKDLEGAPEIATLRELADRNAMPAD